MTSLTRLLAVPALALLASAPLAAADDELAPELRIGEPAPALAHVEWIKGEPVRDYQDDRVYVLDFWATWCGPCIKAIPHMDALADEYADQVDIVGVAIWPREGQRPTDEFVEEKGDAMSYKIASDVDGQTAEAFMNATASTGIPTCMVVDREGRLAWIGHPMGGLDTALAQVVAGEWDLEAAREEYEAGKADQIRQMQLQSKAMPLVQAANEAVADEDWETALAKSRALAELDASLAGWRTLSYRALLELDRHEEARAEGDAILDGSLADNPQFLNSFAWMLAAPGSAVSDEAFDGELALALAERAAELTDRRVPDVLDTLARVHARRGEYTKAVEVQAEAVALASGEQKESLQRTLEEYRAAAGDDSTADARDG